MFIEPKVTRIFEYSSSSFKPIFLSVELGFPDELEQALPLLMAILLASVIPLIQACGGSSGGGTTPTTLDVTVTLPTSITSATLPSPGTVRVYVNKQGEAPIEMVVSGNSATHSFTALSSGISATPVTYEVSIEFDSTLYSAVITLGSASNTVTISSGSNSIAFSDALFDLSDDTDTDSRTNLAELIAGSNPLVPVCVLGSSQLGSCELDS